MDHPTPLDSRPPFAGDMPPEEFRAQARAAVDWVADYLRDVGQLPVLAQVRPGDTRSRLPPVAPEAGEAFDGILEDFRSLILPGITHWNHPAFFAYFANTGSGPGIIAELLASALNSNAMVWQSSPAGTELEIHMAEWIRQLLGLPEGFEGTINDTASHSSMYALAAAREVAYPGVRDSGLSGLPQGRIYASEEAHSSIEKAAMALGFGRVGVRRIPTDDGFRMRPELLEAAIREDRSQGLRTVAVVATVGTTSTTSVDPVAVVAELCQRHGLWLHVDAAYAGVTAMVPEFRHHFTGWERADSIVFNPHKWLFTPMDCSLLYCRRPEALMEAFSLTPEYLRTREEGSARNLMDSGVALGRRFRALKLWFVLRYFGAEGVRLRVREHVRMARHLAEQVAATPGWEMAAPVPFATAVFRFAPAGVSPEEQDRLNLRIMEEVNRSGEIFLSHTRVLGRVVLRLSVGNLRTRNEHVERAWTLLSGAAEKLVPRAAAD